MFDLQIQKNHLCEQQKGFIPLVSSCVKKTFSLSRDKSIRNPALYCVLLRLEVEVYFKREEYETQKIISHLISSCLIFLQEFCQYFTCSGNNKALIVGTSQQSEAALHRGDKRLEQLTQWIWNRLLCQVGISQYPYITSTLLSCLTKTRICPRVWFQKDIKYKK